MSSVINKLFGILNLFDDSLHLLSITPEEVAKSKPLIHSQYYYSAAEDNINTSWLSRLWAKENIVPPYMVSCKSSDEFIFNCHSAKIHASPNQMLYALKRIPRTEIDNVSKDLMYRGLWLLGSGYQKDFIEKTKKISTYYTQLRDCIIEAMEYQALMVFLKIFYLEREAVKIEKDNTLKNIIVSAILKHIEVDKISQNTHGAFLSYSNLSKSQFTYQHYKSLMIIYIVSKQTCEDFIDKKQFESLININNSTMSEIVEFIIQEKLYNRYDTHKLLLGVLYAKAATYSDLESFINEWKSIPLYLKKCNAAKQTKTYIPEQKPQKIEITVPVVDLETKKKQQDQQRREEARKRQEKIEAQKRSYRNQGLCQYCGGAFKKKFIFFTSDICSRCGKKKDY